jgi:hypothetical protein
MSSPEPWLWVFRIGYRDRKVHLNIQMSSRIGNLFSPFSFSMLQVSVLRKTQKMHHI